MAELKRADIKLGYACNSNCVFCGTADKLERPGLNTQEAKDRIFLAWNRGCKKVVLTGGEPTIRSDIVDLVFFAKKCGFEKIELHSNGRMFSSANFTNSIISAGADSFYVAIHSNIPEVHDAITRADGAFKQAYAGLNNLLGAGMHVVTNTVVCKHNYEKLIPITDMLIKLNPERFQLTLVRCLGRAEKNFGEVVPRASDAARNIMIAAKYARSRGADMTIGSMPRCLSEDASELFSENYLPPTEVYEPGKEPYEFDVRQQTAGRTKGKNCLRCKMLEKCEGPWEEYVKHYGFGEFNPIL